MIGDVVAQAEAPQGWRPAHSLRVEQRESRIWKVWKPLADRNTWTPPTSSKYPLTTHTELPSDYYITRTAQIRYNGTLACVRFAEFRLTLAQASIFAEDVQEEKGENARLSTSLISQPRQLQYLTSFRLLRWCDRSRRPRKVNIGP